MKKLLFISLFLLAGSAMAQQQEFRYWCLPPNSSMRVAVSSQTTTSSCNSNVTTPNTANDYPQVTTFFDSTVVIGDGHITNLRVRVHDNGSSIDLCSDDIHAVHVSDGDRIGAYYITDTGVLTIYVGTTAAALTCNVPGLTFPGTVADAIQVEFFKK